jgi:teichuronic acid biosynthesis glycosyltransferase TuaG
MTLSSRHDTERQSATSTVLGGTGRGAPGTTAALSPAGHDARRPLVSVIVPCYNATPFVEATIGSVLCQTWTSLEVLAVDDGSTDATFELLRTISQSDARVRPMQLPRNHGSPAAPRNAGVLAARGEWVAFLDADDIWHPRKLEVQMRVLETHGGVLCSTEMADFRDDGEIVFDEPPAQPPVVRVTLMQQLLKYRTPTSSILARREFMLQHPFNTDLSYRAREDTDCFIRVHEDMPFSVKVAYPLVRYRQQASQISGNKWKMVSRHLGMLRKYRLRSGKSLGVMAYVYTATHFMASLYVRWWRRRL